MLEQMATDSLAWHYTPAETIKKNGGVHIWCFDLDDPGLDLFCDDSVLSDCECQRAERLQGDRQRELFVRRRALRRFLLGQFLEIPPASLLFIETDSGKPRLAEIHATRCEFNTSHSENIFVMAISETGHVGVDVEVVRPEWDWESVAAMYLDGHRLAQIKSFLQLDQQKQFLRFWSLHEAFAKASGCGLTHKSHNAPLPGSVWDLIFESENLLPAFPLAPLTNRTWSQRTFRAGGNPAIVSIVLHQPAPQLFI